MPFQDDSLCSPSSPKELAGIGQSRHGREDALFLFALLGQPGCLWMGMLICRTWGIMTSENECMRQLCLCRVTSNLLPKSCS